MFDISQVKNGTNINDSLLINLMAYHTFSIYKS